MLSRLIMLDKQELEDIEKVSHDEAVRIALQSVSFPAPPMPDFEDYSVFADDKKGGESGWSNSESGGSKYDDFLWRENELEEKDSSSSWEKEERGRERTDEYRIDDDHFPTGVPILPLSITDAEAHEECTKMKNTYNVDVGVSWGTLPYELQKKWLEYSCDYHLA